MTAQNQKLEKGIKLVDGKLADGWLIEEFNFNSTSLQIIAFRNGRVVDYTIPANMAWDSIISTHDGIEDVSKGMVYFVPFSGNFDNPQDEKPEAMEESEFISEFYHDWDFLAILEDHIKQCNGAFATADSQKTFEIGSLKITKEDDGCFGIETHQHSTEFLTVDQMKELKDFLG